MPRKVTRLNDSPTSSPSLLKQEKEAFDPITSAVKKICKTNIRYKHYDAPSPSTFSFLFKGKCLSAPQTDAETLKKNITNFFSTLLKELSVTDKMPPLTTILELFQAEILKTTTIPARIDGACKLYHDKEKYGFLKQFQGLDNLLQFWKEYEKLLPAQKETLQTVVGDKGALDILEYYQDEANFIEVISEWQANTLLIEKKTKEIEGRKFRFRKEFAADFHKINNQDIRDSFRALWKKKGSRAFFRLNSIPMELPDLDQTPTKDEKQGFLDWLVDTLKNSHNRKQLSRLSGSWLKSLKEEGCKDSKISDDGLSTLLKFLSINAFSPVVFCLREHFPELFTLEHDKPILRQSKENPTRYSIFISEEDGSFRVTQIKKYKFISIPGDETTVEEAVLGSMTVLWSMHGNSKGEPTKSELSLKNLTFTPDA
nr:hypothetical protein [Chlamydiota bacterium]